MAAFLGHFGAVKRLLELGADVNLPVILLTYSFCCVCETNMCLCQITNTPLHKATMKQNPLGVKLLLDHNADVNLVDDKVRCTHIVHYDLFVVFTTRTLPHLFLLLYL